MKLMFGLLSVALGFSSAAQAGAYTCIFEDSLKVVKQCNIDSASPSTDRCTYPFSGTNLTGICGVTPSGSEELLYCEIGVLPAANAGLSGLTETFLNLAQSKSPAAALVTLGQLPGFAAAAATLAPPSKAFIHLGYMEKQGAPLYSAICPATFAERR